VGLSRFITSGSAVQPHSGLQAQPCNTLFLQMQAGLHRVLSSRIAARKPTDYKSLHTGTTASNIRVAVQDSLGMADASTQGGSPSGVSPTVKLSFQEDNTGTSPRDVTLSHPATPADLDRRLKESQERHRLLKERVAEKQRRIDLERIESDNRALEQILQETEDIDTFSLPPSPKATQKRQIVTADQTRRHKAGAGLTTGQPGWQGYKSHKQTGKQPSTQASWEDDEEEVQVNLRDLRRMQSLRDQVDQQFETWGLSEPSHRAQRQEQANHTAAGKSCSGFSVKNSGQVNSTQEYAHNHHKYAKNINFDSMTLGQFVAGEMEIIDSYCRYPAEVKGRKQLLKEICYLSDLWEWGTLKQYYKAVVEAIEGGFNQWGGDYTEIRNMIRDRAFALQAQRPPSPQAQSIGSPGQSTFPNGPYYCREWNLGTCTQTGPHFGMLRGQSVEVQHICGKCAKSGRIMPDHNDTYMGCPNKSPSHR
jgi:hypothetical protein